MSIPVTVRRLLVPGSLIVAAACGSSSTDITTPPPPPPAGSPASIAVQAGDGQQAEPGAAVATHPAVLVRDSAGQPLPGVIVTFTVDSGGGTLSATTATTGSNGIATAGTWTLGRAEGRNVLRVTVGSLASVRMVATAAIVGATLPTATIGSGGGAITVLQPGPLNGFSITVPGGAFTTSLVATISYASNASIPRTPTMNPVSPLITIATTTADYATAPLTIHIAATIPAGDFPVIVVYDPSSGAKEALTTVAWDATGVTALTTTLSSAHLLSTASLRANVHGAALAGPGMEAVVSALPPAVLNADYDSGYLPGTDDWEFPTTQTELAATNQNVNTIGSAATSLWYYTNGGISRAKLNGRFMLQAGVPLSDRVGLRWAGVIGAMFDANAINTIRYSGTNVGNEVEFDQNQFRLIRTKFALSAEDGGRPKPQLMEVVSGDGATFYLIVYRVSGTRLYVADPFVPGDASRFLDFPAGALMTPYSAVTPSGATPVATRPTALGLSSLISVDQLPVTYAKVLDGTIGQDIFPSYELHGWAGRLYDTLFIVDTLRWWVECPNCTYGYATNLSPSPSHKVAGGEFIATKPPALDLGAFPANGFLAHTLPTAGNDYLLGLAVGSAHQAQSASTAALWIDWHPFVLRRLQTAILPNPLTGPAASPFKMTFQVAQNLLPSHVNYVWDFGDHQPAVTVTVADNPAVQHTYATPGTYQVTAQIVDTRNSQVIGKVTAPATITVPQFAWQFTSVAETGSQLPPGGIDPDDQLDQQILGFFTGWVNNLQNSPRNSEFFVYSDASCSEILLEMWPAGQFQPAIDFTNTVGKALGIFGLNPACDADHDYAAPTLAMGTLGQGTLVGSLADIPKTESIVLPGGSINGVMSGTTLSGTFTWRVRYKNGEAVYSFNFTATQVLPVP